MGEDGRPVLWFALVYWIATRPVGVRATGVLAKCFSLFPSMSMPTRPRRSLETFPNPNPRREYAIRMRMPEFTCLCPKTGQPDFATLFLEYVPDARCVELKSLKLYLWSFRDQGAFHEAVTNRILDDLVAATHPRFMRLTAVWNLSLIHI